MPATRMCCCVRLASSACRRRCLANGTSALNPAGSRTTPPFGGERAAQDPAARGQRNIRYVVAADNDGEDRCLWSSLHDVPASPLRRHQDSRLPACDDPATNVRREACTDPVAHSSIANRPSRGCLDERERLRVASLLESRTQADRF